MRDDKAPAGTTEKLIASAAVRFSTEPLNDSVLDAAVSAVLDWVGCAVGAAESGLARSMMLFLAEEAPEGGHASVLLPGSPSASARTAALINGAISHVLELDDIFAPALYHPGVCVIPAALAGSQIAGASGERFLRAVIAGYEVSNRLGSAINPQHYRFWHTTGTVGALGAAVAASVAIGLDARKTGWAIGNAATMAAGLKQAFASDGMTKPLHAGRAAEAGTTAACLARAGVTSADAMISGPTGLAAAMAGGADTAQVMADLFDDWSILRPTLKRFASCGHTFAAVDVALGLCADHRIDAADVARIDIRTYSEAIAAAGITEPSTPFEARFSIAFCVAAAIVGYDLADPSSFDEAVQDAKTQELGLRVSVSPCEKLDARFPALRGAAVTLVTRNGRVFKAETPTRKGAPENPLTAEEIRIKAKCLIVRGGGDSEAWIAWCDGLKKAASIEPGTLPMLGVT